MATWVSSPFRVTCSFVWHSQHVHHFPLEGCGFCPDYFFEKLGVGGYDAIQLRIACPAIGLAKGMLLKKSNISHIQLPESMLKAPFSDAWETNNYAAVIIKNKFPSEENKKFGSFLDPCATDPCKSWTTEDRKPLSKMYQRILVGFGVNRADVNAYTRKAKNHKKLKHGESMVCHRERRSHCSIPTFALEYMCRHYSSFEGRY